MKKQVLTLILGSVLSSFAFAGDAVNSVAVKGSGSAIAAGFEAWAKQVTQVGGPGGQVLAQEVKAWVAKEKSISK